MGMSTSAWMCICIRIRSHDPMYARLSVSCLCVSVCICLHTHTHMEGGHVGLVGAPIPRWASRLYVCDYNSVSESLCCTVGVCLCVCDAGCVPLFYLWSRVCTAVLPRAGLRGEPVFTCVPVSHTLSAAVKMRVSRALTLPFPQLPSIHSSEFLFPSTHTLELCDPCSSPPCHRLRLVPCCCASC